MMEYYFFDRDLSWLTFNGRILDEAERNNVPLLERIRFLAIHSSNLDEFYRVRMPVINALNILAAKRSTKRHLNRHIPGNPEDVEKEIGRQQEKFGAALNGHIIPGLKEQNIQLIYNCPLPAELQPEINSYFSSQVLGYLHPIFLGRSKKTFFPENNKLYFLISLTTDGTTEQTVFLNIPSDHLQRFYSITKEGCQYILFLDDIIRFNLDKLFPGAEINGCYSFKVNRDAALDLEEDYSNDIAALIEKQLMKRDLGLATRLLYEPGVPSRFLQLAIARLSLNSAGIVAGGRYHNLRDLFSLPVKNTNLEYEKWPALAHDQISPGNPIWDSIAKQDILICAPYHAYDPVLRFFNEAATDPAVTEIYTSIYRVASDSRIAAALITAAANGKKVQVLVELKARFDEANNIKWAKQMKQAGVTILYSSKKIKVHAKVALVKRRSGKPREYYGLLATGNFNEGTAAFYTDFILMTTDRKLLLELEQLFELLSGKVKIKPAKKTLFNDLLVAGYNLKEKFIQLIDREISNARSGLSAAITIKVNNLQEQDLISKLYDASSAGVQVSLIVRSICCVVPGKPGMSENITVTRIVDRYLEHSRVFIFHNQDNPDVFLGSADWMNRNIYHRIEVCFPVKDKAIKEQVIKNTGLQLADNCQAVNIDQELNNVPKTPGAVTIQSQREIYLSLSRDAH